MGLQGSIEKRALGAKGIAPSHPRWVLIGPDFPTTNPLFGKFLKQGLNAGCLFSICSGCFFLLKVVVCVGVVVLFVATLFACLFFFYAIIL